MFGHPNFPTTPLSGSPILHDHYCLQFGDRVIVRVRMWKLYCKGCQNIGMSKYSVHKLWLRCNLSLGQYLWLFLWSSHLSHKRLKYDKDKQKQSINWSFFWVLGKCQTIKTGNGSKLRQRNKQINSRFDRTGLSMVLVILGQTHLKKIRSRLLLWNKKGSLNYWLLFVKWLKRDI